MPVATMQAHCTEAARAAALASHSAAGLAAAAGLREAARLLRSSEAMARAAVAALLAHPLTSAAPTAGSGSGDGAAAGTAAKAKKKRNKKKKTKDQAAMDGVVVVPELPPTAGGVLSGGPVASSGSGGVPCLGPGGPASVGCSASVLSRDAVDFVPGSAARAAGGASRRSSPYGGSASPSTSATSTSTPALAGGGCFTEGHAVVLKGLSSRADLIGACGVVVSFDVAASRYAVRLDASGETVKVLEKNMQSSLFVPGGMVIQ